MANPKTNSKSTCPNKGSNPPPPVPKIPSLTSMRAELFVGPDMNIVKVLVDESIFQNIAQPAFQEKSEYKKKIEDLTLTINSNLSLLKNSCFEINWLDDYTELLDENSNEN